MNDQKYWKWRFLYFNRNDNRVFVPKRFGIGWTLNWASPFSYIAIIVILIVLVQLCRFF